MDAAKRNRRKGIGMLLVMSLVAAACGGSGGDDGAAKFEEADEAIAVSGDGDNSADEYEGPESMSAMGEVIHSIVSEIPPLDPLEREHQADARKWIGSGCDIFRTAKPATPPKHLVSYCVLVDPDDRLVLLVDHRDAQLWLPTGGHVDPDEHPASAASREIREELGIRPPFLPAVGDVPLMITVTETTGRSEAHTDVSLWFAFEGSQERQLAPDKSEFVATRWWGL